MHLEIETVITVTKIPKFIIKSLEKYYQENLFQEDDGSFSCDADDIEEFISSVLNGDEPSKDLDRLLAFFEDLIFRSDYDETKQYQETKVCTFRFVLK